MKILFLTSRFPWPLEKGDKLRAYHLIRELSAEADIFLFAINDKDVSEEQLNALRPYCKDIQWAKVAALQSLASMTNAALGTIPFQAAYFYSAKAVKQLRVFAERTEADIVFCHLLRMAPYAEQLPSGKKYIDLMDAFSTAMERYVTTAAAWIKPAAKTEAARLKNYEAKLIREFSGASIISAQDRSYMPESLRDKVNVIPNGVDVNYYHPQASEFRQEIIFLGNMAYIPNIASVAFTVKQVLPELEKLQPGCRFLIAGANPASEVKALQGTRVRVSGWLEDVRSELAASAVMIAPMLISVGQQNKILQAMAMKVPCVVSALAANALGAEDGKEVLVAETPSEYAAKIHQLLNNPDLRNAISENAYQWVHQQYAWSASGKMLLESLRSL